MEYNQLLKIILTSIGGLRHKLLNPIIHYLLKKKETNCHG
jgi:hypothetical protein